MQIDCRTHPVSFALGTGGSLPSVKWQGHEADHTLFVVLLKLMSGAVAPLPLYTFMACMEKLFLS